MLLGSDAMTYSLCMTFFFPHEVGAVYNAVDRYQLRLVLWAWAVLPARPGSSGLIPSSDYIKQFEHVKKILTRTRINNSCSVVKSV